MNRDNDFAIIIPMANEEKELKIFTDELKKVFNAGNGEAMYWNHYTMYNKGANWISSEAAIKILITESRC